MNLNEVIELTREDLEFTGAGMPCNNLPSGFKFQGVTEDGTFMVIYYGRMGEGLSLYHGAVLHVKLSDYLKFTIGKIVKLIPKCNILHGEHIEVIVSSESLLYFRSVDRHGKFCHQLCIEHPRLAQLLADKTFRIVEGEWVEV